MTATTTALPAAPPPAALTLVPFHDTDVLAARAGDEVRIFMKRYCGSIGLPWDAQRQRIERSAVLRKGARMMLAPSEGGEQEQVTLPLGMLPGFLFGVATSRLEPTLRARVELFQAECFDVLYAHFARPAAPPAPVIARPGPPVWQELDAARRAAPALLAALTAERRPAVRAYLHALLAADGERLRLPVPALADMGEATPSADERIARLVEGLEVLTARKVRWNHLGSRTNGRMALVLPELARQFAHHDVDVQVDAELRAALRSTHRWHIRQATIDSAIARKRVLATIVAPFPNGELGRG